MIDEKTGYFLISLDTELAWGHYDLDQLRLRNISVNGVRERENIARLLKLFNDFGIVGTWAVVGHLFFGKCEECEVCPVLDWEGSYDCFREIYETANQQWYGSDIIDMILRSQLPQEIGFHGYTHRVFDETLMSTEEARIEAEEWLRAASKWGIGPGSIVFPRNQLGHTPLLKELGFVCFRGEELVPAKWRSLGNNGLGSLFAKLRPYLSPPEVYEPRLDGAGLVDLPASRWIGTDHRVERVVRLDTLYGLRLEKIAAGVRAAAREKKILHIWLHPYELRKEGEFEKIRKLLSVVAELVERGSLRSVGMAQLGRHFLPILLKRSSLEQNAEQSK